MCKPAKRSSIPTRWVREADIEAINAQQSSSLQSQAAARECRAVGHSPGSLQIR